MSVARALKESAKIALQAAGLLPLARRCLAPLRALARTRTSLQRSRYHRLLVEVYASPFARPAESYEGYERREAELRNREIAERFAADTNAILAAAARLFGPSAPAADTEASFIEHLVARYAQGPDAPLARNHAAAICNALRALAGADASAGRAAPLAARVAAFSRRSPAEHAAETDPAPRVAAAGFAGDRHALLRTLLDRVIDPNRAPRFYDYDYVDDIVGIVGTRYCGDAGCDVAAVRAVLDALCALAEPAGGLEWKDLPAALHRALGSDHGYVPKRGDVSRHVWEVIPDLADEFIKLKAERNVERFLEINREYSRRQAVTQGLWDNRELSLLRGYERDRHLLLRTLVRLMADRELTRDDEVLMIGPRHVDEVVFFRRRLGLPRTVGLDLFAYGRDEILAGDMHRMPFESGRFKLVYCAGTLSYSFDARRVIEEIARVARRPGFVFLVDAAGRKAGPDALGRSDVIGIDTLVGMFYRHAFQVLARDAGRSLAPDSYDNEPCLALRLLEGARGLPA